MNKEKQTLNKIKVATVWWKDAYSHNEDVSSGEEVQNSLICISSGILLEQNDEAIKLAMDLFDVQDGQQSRSFRSIGVIPMEFVQRIVLQEIEIYDKLSASKSAKKIQNRKRPSKKKEETITKKESEGNEEAKS